MDILDRITLVNHARIPCTMRTLRPFEINDKLPAPWVHYGEVADALLYLASRTGLPDAEISALKETLEELSYLLKNSSGSPDHHLVEENENTIEQ